MQKNSLAHKLVERFLLFLPQALLRKEQLLPRLQPQGEEERGGEVQGQEEDSDMCSSSSVAPADSTPSPLLSRTGGYIEDTWYEEQGLNLNWAYFNFLHSQGLTTVGSTCAACSPPRPRRR